MIRFWTKAIDRINDLSHKSPLFRWTLPMGQLLLIFGAGGLLVAVSGAIPIKASSGHWAITHTILEFVKERSVATQSLGITSPPLNDPVLILKGAGHYEIGCRPCHGSPELHHPKIASRMLPPPPYLAETAPKWEPEQLFYMIKHGIKFTGMPAWPSPQRDDEVWAIVAFLRVFPDLNVDSYRRLVNGETDANEQAVLFSIPEPETTFSSLTKSCNACHGRDGQGRDVAAFPKLAGQRPEYFVSSMEAFARGDRHSGIMEPIAAGLSPMQLSELARHYAGFTSSPTFSEEKKESIQRGADIARRGIPKQDVPACAACHDSGNISMNPHYPSLNGQFEDYIVLQLTLFKQGDRGGTPFSHLMGKVVAEMEIDQIRDVARYFASQQLNMRNEK